MTDNRLPSIGGGGTPERPPSLLLRPAIPFGMAPLAASSAVPPPPSRSSPRSLPNWARLGAGAADDAGAAGTEGEGGGASSAPTPVRNGASAPADGPALAPAYSSPREASAAYRSGLLRSDPTVAPPGRPSIRVAFRYLDERPAGADGDADGGDEGGEAELFLCWVRRDGVPCHFRPMRPRRANAAAPPGGADGTADVVANGDVDAVANGEEGSPPSSTDDVASPLVNENDRIERTYPGDAFVFCRRVDYVREGNDAAADDADNAEDDGSRNEDDPVVVNDDGKTYFLRKIRSDGEQEEEGEEEEGEDRWESYLVVGGFRPGPMPDMITEEEDDGSEAEGDRVGSNGGNDRTNEERDGEGDADVSGSDSDSDDESYVGEIVQLVTIRLLLQRSDPAANGASSTMATNLRGAAGPPRDVGADDGADEGNAAIDAAEEFAYEIAARASRLDPAPLDTSSKRYDRVLLGGWPCRVEPGAFPPDMDVPATGRNLLRSRFASDLEAAAACLPPAARDRLRGSTPVWINRSQSFGPRAAPVRGRDGCFHPGAGWLRRNGMSPDKCGGVEWYDARHYLSDCDLWGPGGLMLHELSHAWHCLHVPGGYDNLDVKRTWERAMEQGLYDCVPVHGPQGPRCKAYACTDQMEYFAELSVAFLGGLDATEHNKWFPFNRAQVREHDPGAFDMLCRIWGVEGEERAADEGGSGGEASREG